MKLNRYTTDSCSPSTLSRLPAMDAWFAAPFTGFSALNPVFDFGRLVTAPASRLATDVFEDDDHFYARLEVPGVKKEDVKVELADRKLTISITRRENTADGERTHSLARSLTVPDSVADEAISAHLEDGLLTVTLPKQEQRKPRVIEIH
jgi:HSP20 family protein